jgi:transmembrane sensor
MKKETDKNLQYVLKYYAAGRLDTRKALRAVKQRAGIGVRRPSPWRWAGMAAMLLVLLATGAYVWLRLSTTTLEAGSSVVAYTLADGTRVTLSPHSTLSYRKADCRTVAMTGHIYFQVRHDAQHPFDIEGAMSHVRVLGTQFDVAETESRSEVFVTHGRVLFTAQNETEGVILTRGMKASLLRGARKPVTTGVADINQVAWATHQFHFDGTRVSEALRVLSDYYGVQYTVSDSSKCLTGDFDAADKDQIISVIEQTLGVKIQEKQR